MVNIVSGVRVVVDRLLSMRWGGVSMVYRWLIRSFSLYLGQQEKVGGDGQTPVGYPPLISIMVSVHSIWTCR